MSIENYTWTWCIFVSFFPLANKYLYWMISMSYWIWQLVKLIEFIKWSLKLLFLFDRRFLFIYCEILFWNPALIILLFLHGYNKTLSNFDWNLAYFFFQGKLPTKGWTDSEIEEFLKYLAKLDTNNFPHNVGVGEREARIFSGECMSNLLRINSEWYINLIAMEFC